MALGTDVLNHLAVILGTRVVNPLVAGPHSANNGTESANLHMALTPHLLDTGKCRVPKEQHPIVTNESRLWGNPPGNIHM